MSFNRIKLSEDATNRLRVLKSRTGLDRNFLCRIAFCHSLNDDYVPDPTKYKETKESQVLDRSILLGEYDPLYIAMLKERLLDDGLDPEKDLLPMFKAHINRGVSSIYNRIKSIGDLEGLLRSNV